MRIRRVKTHLQQLRIIASPWRVGCALLLPLLAPNLCSASQQVINGPAGSGLFGQNIVLLTNGNFLVMDAEFDLPGPINNVGAIYLLAPDGTQISRVTGTVSGDRVGNGGSVVLANGNAVVRSATWSNGSAFNAGAVTFINGVTGLNGTVSAGNSLVGTRTDDAVGKFDTVALANGNYVVRSPDWDNGIVDKAGAATFGNGLSGVSGAVSPGNSLVGTQADDAVGRFITSDIGNSNYLIRSERWNNGVTVNAGAVTFGNGQTGVSGVVSPINSLVGSSAGDQIGGGSNSSDVVVLANGNYVVLSPTWNNGALNDAGAATFGNGNAALVGPITSTNSLVGTSTDDLVGNAGVIALANGNYVVGSRDWDRGVAEDAGAATFGSGAAGLVGPITLANSLLGSQEDDRVGSRLHALTNGNYVVASPNWANGALPNAGAATFANGNTGRTGEITAANSLVGTVANSFSGNGDVIALTNGNYVVLSPDWFNGAVEAAGAATFCNGTSGCSGAIDALNSLVGTQEFDFVGNGGVALSNDNYVIVSRDWANGAVPNVGAATFGNGTSGVSGTISSANSLLGSTADDGVGEVTALRNGNYVVATSDFDSGAVQDIGAATFGNGTTGVTGTINPGNSLLGSAASDRVGSVVFALDDGNYVLGAPSWDNAGIVNAGAVTFGNGSSGISGVVSPTNSLVGLQQLDRVGAHGIEPQSDSTYIVSSFSWDNSSIADAGAISLGAANTSTPGAISADNSVLGTIADLSNLLRFEYDAFRRQMLVGLAEANQVVLHRPGIATNTGTIVDTPDPSGDNQPTTFTVSVAAFPRPLTGRVTVTASTGESCIDTSGTVGPGPITLVFSCAITFTTSGTRQVIAEYTGSNDHSYSRSAAEPHTAITSFLFGNSFE